MWWFGRSRVQMIHSVDNYVAGKKYWIPKATADRFVIKNYASGNIKQDLTDEEKAAIRDDHQILKLTREEYERTL